MRSTAGRAAARFDPSGCTTRERNSCDLCLATARQKKGANGGNMVSPVPNSQVQVDPSGTLLLYCETTPSERLPVDVEPLPDLGSLTDEDLKSLIDELTKDEQEISFQRRILHGKIDILRAELVARLHKTEGRSVLDQVDVEALTNILTSKAAPPT
jgi:hypothetical protein